MIARAISLVAVTNRAVPAVALGVAGLILVALASCGGAPSFSFAVGDCVKINRQIIDQKLEDAECPSDGAHDPTDRIYSVDKVIDDVDGTCGAPQGFGGVEFKDEPDDAVYCLSFAD